MAVTTFNDLFIPQAVGPMIVDAVTAKLAFLTAGAVASIPAEQVFANGGENPTFPTFTTDASGSGLAQDSVRDSRTGVTPDKLTMDSYTEQMENKTVSVDLDSHLFMDAKGLMDELVRTVSQGMSLAMQASLVRKAIATDLLVDRRGLTTKTLTVDAILRAKLAWGDFASSVPSPILFVSAKQFGDLAETTEFKTLGSAASGALVTAADGANAVIARVHGVNLVLLDAVPNTANKPAITGVTRSGSVATATTATAHKLIPGQVFELTGADPTGYNGSFVVLATPTATTFTFTVSGTPATPATTPPVFSTTPTYEAMLCAPCALGLCLRKEVGLERIPHAGSTVATYDAHGRYVTTMFRRRPRGVVRLATH